MTGTRWGTNKSCSAFLPSRFAQG